MDQAYVIVGGGLAGATAALTLRSAGFDGRVRIVCGEEHTT
jgi:NADPH-dependent 2,4-dienoyl-CoA reductase/sulfur reductase-like enzyme